MRKQSPSSFQVNWGTSELFIAHAHSGHRVSTARAPLPPPWGFSCISFQIHWPVLKRFGHPLGGERSSTSFSSLRCQMRRTSSLHSHPRGSAISSPTLSSLLATCRTVRLSFYCKMVILVCKLPWGRVFSCMFIVRYQNWSAECPKEGIVADWVGSN